MEFKQKSNETMLWIDSLKKIVRFTNGVAKVDEKTGNEMKKLGYIENSSIKPSKKEPEVKKVEVVVEETQPQPETPKVQPIKPIRPMKAKADDSDISEEV